MGGFAPFIKQKNDQREQQRSHHPNPARVRCLLGLAIIAHELSVPFYVAMPLSTVDPTIASGAEIPIEVRGEDELRVFNGRAIVPAAAGVYNPAFDITPHRYVTAFITERGVVSPPYLFKI